MRFLHAAPLLGLLFSGSALSAEPDQVTMNLQEFLKLYEKTRNPDEKPENAPRHFSVSSASYDGEVVLEDGEPASALFTGTFTVQVHKRKGWVKVPLLPRQVAVQSAKIDGREAPIVLEGGSYTLVTDKKGTVDVEVTFAVKVATAQGSSGFSFDLTPSGATDLTLAVPVEEDLDFVVANSRLQSDKVVGTKRVVEATLPASGALSVRWQREIPVAERADEARVYSEVYSLVGLGDGLVSSRIRVKNTILFAGVDTFEYAIPKGSTVLDVRGTGLRDWSVDEAGKLTVSLNYAAENANTLSIDLERVVGQGSVDLDAPLVVPLDVERSKGWVGIEARGNLEIDGGDTTNAAVVDVRTLPAEILGVTDQPVLLGYKYLGTDTTIPLAVKQHDDVDVLVTLLDQAEATTMFTADGRRLTSVRYEVRNNRRQFLRLGLPEGAELWSASVAGRAVQPAKSGEQLLVPLIRSQSAGGSLASFGVEVVYVESGAAPDARGKGTFDAALPAVDVPTTYVAWTVYVPDQAKVKRKSHAGTVRNVEFLSRPLGATDTLMVAAESNGMRRSGNHQASTGALGDGAAPVRVRLPVEGEPVFFEKLLALDEELRVAFVYTGLKN